MPKPKKANSSINLWIKKQLKPLQPSKKTLSKLSKIKRRIFKHVWLLRISIAVLIVAIVGFGVFFVYKSRIANYVAPAVNFIFTTNANVESQDGRTNILMLGAGGEGHEGPDLTDTIIFASISKIDNKVTLISLPRDIYLVDQQLKVNHAFSDAKEKSGTQQGLENAKKVISQVIGQPINYVVVIDFNGFTKFIDTLGGIEVNVNRTFTDAKYPITGAENDLCGLVEGLGEETYTCRYQTITFIEGTQTMDGETALKFSRSRHSSDPLEGNDFARAARQQKVIDAIKNKILSTGVMFSPDKISQLIAVGESSVKTDLTKEEGAVLAREAFDARDNIISAVLNKETGLLYEPPISPYRYFGQYVLLPKGANFDQIHQWVQTLLP